MFDIDTYIHKVIEVFGVLTKIVHGYRRVRVQRCHIQQRDIPVHARFGIDIAAQTKVCSTEHVVHPAIVAFGPLVTREGIDDVFGYQNIRLDLGQSVLFAGSKVSVDKLWMFLFAKDDARGQCVGRIVDRQSGNICQDLPGYKVCMTCVEHGFCCQNVIVAVFRDLVPKAFRHGLVPR